jgi:AcrR family transcriptional regulator
MKRNRTRTAEKFINAVHAILMEEGYGALGINAVAQRAGANKVLLYRYFGSLEGLLEQYVDRMDPFPNLIEAIEHELGNRETLTVDEVCRIIFTTLEQAILENPSFAEMLKWEIVSSNHLTQKIAQSREQSGRQLTEYLKEHYHWDKTKDIEAVLAILTGGLFYLWMREDSVCTFNGVPLSRPEGRQRLLLAATDIVKSIFS